MLPIKIDIGNPPFKHFNIMTILPCVMTKPRSLVVMTFRKGVRAVQLVGKASEFRRILNL